MRTIAVFGAIAAGWLCAGCGAYYAYGPSRLPYQGQAFHRAREIQLGYSPRRFPHWSAALAATVARDRASATFVEPTCGCRPEIYAQSEALDVQYRWQTTRSVHPVASAKLGRVSTGYFYGVPELNDSTQTAPFVTVRGGGEFSLSSWLHVVLLAGYRQSFRKTTLNTTVSHAGLDVASLIVFGKHYRTP